MFRIVKIVSLPQGQSAEFYLTQLGYWVQDKKDAAKFGELVAYSSVARLNKKADKHYCNDMSGKFQITTYLMEEI
jgi:hypothetical protein